MRRGGGFTLLEVLISAGVMTVVLGAAYLVLSSAMGTAFKGMAYSGVLTGVSDFTDHLFHDLEQMVALQKRPGRRAVRISQDGKRLAFLVPRRDLLVDVLGDALVPPPGTVIVEPSKRTTDDFTVYASPVLYRPAPRPVGLFSPARDDVAIGSCLLSQWSFALTTPTTGSAEERYEKKRTERLMGRPETDEQMTRGVMLKKKAPGAASTFAERDGENEEEASSPGGVVQRVHQGLRRHRTHQPDAGRPVGTADLGQGGHQGLAPAAADGDLEEDPDADHRQRQHQVHPDRPGPP